MTVSEFIKDKAIKRYIAITSEEGSFEDYATRMTMEDLYKEYAKSDDTYTSDRFEAEVNRLLMESAYPSQHQMVSYNGKAVSFYRILCEFIRADDPKIKKADAIKEKRKIESIGPKRFIEYFDGNSDSWRRDWIVFNLDSLSLYEVVNKNGKIDFDPMLKEHMGTLRLIESDDRRFFAATSPIEAKLLYLIQKSGDNNTINGVLSVEEMIQEYSYSESWNSIEVNEVPATLSEEIDDALIYAIKEWNRIADYRNLTQDELKSQIEWSIRRLCIYIPESSMINPVSLWVRKGIFESSFVLKEASDWYEYLNFSDENELPPYCELCDPDFRELGLVPYEEIFKDSVEKTFWDYNRNLYVFPFSMEKLERNGIIRMYRQGNFCLHALNKNDAAHKIISYLICTIYNNEGQNNSSNHDSREILKNKSESFLKSISPEIIDCSDDINRGYFSIDPEYNHVFEQMFKLAERKRKSPGYFDGEITIYHHIFSFLEKMNCYILFYCNNITDVCPGLNPFDAEGEAGLKEDERMRQNPKVAKFTLSPYSPGYRIEYSFNYDSMAYYLLSSKRIRNRDNE